MAKKTVTAINLAPAIKEILDEYGDTVYDVLGDCIDTVAEEAVQKLQAENKFAPGGHPSGAYAKSWTSEKLRAGRLGVKTVVHNEEHYRLTHLLEKGHVTRNGTGRTYRPTPAYPHIAPVNDWVVAELPRKVKEKL